MGEHYSYVLTRIMDVNGVPPNGRLVKYVAIAGRSGFTRHRCSA